jgi:integral membrane protein
MNLLTTSIGRLRVIGFLEGLSFLFLLLIAMPVKYLAGEPMLVRITGMIHGLLFVGYVLKVIIVKFELNWSVKKSFLALVASVIPFGTFYADSRLFRN